MGAIDEHSNHGPAAVLRCLNHVSTGRLIAVMLINRPYFDAVCWDWNGTLLDDVGVARVAMNEVLQTHQLPTIADEDEYRQLFGFPIRSFYSRVGVGEGAFVEAANQYLRLFAQTVGQASLQHEARATLAAIGALGVEQVLISATPKEVLKQQLAPHALNAHFSEILGITDVYAASKAHVVASWLESSGHNPQRVLMVGDTNHDEEIAEALNVRFLRYSRGHQESQSQGPHPVVDNLRDVVTFLGQSARSNLA